MTKYYVMSQHPMDERVFTLKDFEGNVLEVDLFTDGNTGLQHDCTEDEYYEHLRSFVGKTVEIPELQPWRYFSQGRVTVL